MGRLLTVLLIFAALAGCGYNWLQVQHLQTEVDQLKLEVAKKLPASRKSLQHSSPEATPVSADKDAAVQDQIDGWNALAAQHYANAQRAISKSDAPLAAKEYAAYMDDKRNALVLEENEAVHSIDTLRKLAGLKSDTASTPVKPETANP